MHEWGNFLFDKVGNHIRCDEYLTFQKILLNRTFLPSLEEFFVPLPELKDASFQITSTMGGWYDKPGKQYLEFNKDFNGLTYTVKYRSDVGKDNEYQFEYVNDKCKNKMMQTIFGCVLRWQKMDAAILTLVLSIYNLFPDIDFFTQLKLDQSVANSSFLLCRQTKRSINFCSLISSSFG